MTQWVPDSCTLPTEQIPLRVREFDDLLARRRGMTRPDRTRLVLTFDAEEERTARDLAARESRCCSFFTFAFGRDNEGQLEVEIVVPASQEIVLDGLERQAQAVQQHRAQAVQR